VRLARMGAHTWDSSVSVARRVAGAGDGGVSLVNLGVSLAWQLGLMIVHA